MHKPDLRGYAERIEFEPLLDSEEAGLLMHLHPESVKRLARAGRITAAKVGGVWRFRASALEEYLRVITRNASPRSGSVMAPSESAVCVARNGRK